MSSNLSSLIQQAQKGYTTAIATLLNQSLESLNLTATIERQGSKLNILIEGAEAPSPAIAERVKKGLEKIQPTQVREAVIYGQQFGESMPQWSKHMSLRSTPRSMRPLVPSPPVQQHPNSERQYVQSNYSPASSTHSTDNGGGSIFDFFGTIFSFMEFLGEASDFVSDVGDLVSGNDGCDCDEG